MCVSFVFRQTVGHLANFRHDEKDVEIVIRIDDGIIASPAAEMAEIKQIFQGRALTNKAKSISARSRKKTEKGFTTQADPEFYDRLLGETHLDQGVSSPTPETNAMKPTAG